MGMHEPGWRERNEEKAWEDWRYEVLGLCAKVREAAELVQGSLWKGTHSGAIVDATEMVDAASEALFKLRGGPENPENQS